MVSGLRRQRKISDDLGDDAGRGDVGDAGEGQRTGNAPPKGETDECPRNRVCDEIDDPGPGLALSGLNELVSGVLEPEKKKQQDDAEFCQRGYECVAGVHYGQAALTEEKSGEQVERNRRDLPAPSEPSDDPQSEDEQPELEEDRADFLTRGGGRHNEGVDLVHCPWHHT